jgi:hypothetical protein
VKAYFISSRSTNTNVAAHTDTYLIPSRSGAKRQEGKARKGMTVERVGPNIPCKHQQ